MPLLVDCGTSDQRPARFFAMQMLSMRTSERGSFQKVTSEMKVADWLNAAAAATIKFQDFFIFKISLIKNKA